MVRTLRQSQGDGFESRAVSFLFFAKFTSYIMKEIGHEIVEGRARIPYYFFFIFSQIKMNRKEITHENSQPKTGF